MEIDIIVPSPSNRFIVMNHSAEFATSLENKIIEHTNPSSDIAMLNLPRDSEAWIGVRNFVQHSIDYFYSLINDDFDLDVMILCKFFCYISFKMILKEESNSSDEFHRRISLIYGTDGVDIMMDKIEYLSFTKPEADFVEDVVKTLFDELTFFDQPPQSEDDDDFMSYNPRDLNIKSIFLLGRVIHKCRMKISSFTRTSYPYLRQFLVHTTSEKAIREYFRMSEVHTFQEKMNDYLTNVW